MRTLVELLELEDVTGEARAMAESGKAQYGQLLDTWRALLQRSEIFATYLPFLRSVAGPGVLDAKTKDLSAVLVAWLNGCRYTVSHRCASAIRNGVTVQELQAVVSLDWTGFEPKLQTALELTRQLTLAPPQVSWSQEPQAVSQPVLKDLALGFTQPEIVELSMSISIWNGLARFHRVMGLELDMPEPPDGLDPASSTRHGG